MSQENGSPDLQEFPSGAVRNKDGSKERYDLFSPIAMEALARVFGEGAEEYPPWNWEKGLSISFLVNRALRHWFLYASGDRSEDHLAKCEWGFHTARHSEEAWPHLNLDMRRTVGDQANVPPVVDDETAASWRKFKESMGGLRKEYRETEGRPDETAGGMPIRFHFLSAYDNRERLAQYRTDLQWEGHEVVTRWIDGPSDMDMELFDIQSCDVCLVLARGDGQEPFIDKARHFGKEVVVIGSCPPGFPEHGTPDRLFPTWDDFMRDLSSSRTARKEAPSSR